MFQEAYKKAYAGKVPERDFLQKIEDKCNENQGWKRKGAVLRPVVAAVAVCLGVGVTLTPVMAREFSGVYHIVEKYAPALAEYILPVDYSSSNAGILMQVEAVNINEKDAEVLVSFTDEPGFDYIQGKVDMYDSYHITSYSGDSNVGGCSFLEYDEAEDKAYFKLQMSSWDSFDVDKFRFQVGMLLTNCAEERVAVDLSDMDRTPILKSVTLNGAGGTMSAQLQQYLGASEEEVWREGAKVLQGSYDSTFTDKLEITGIGYQDGILRIQICRGNFKEADRHMQIMLVDAQGNERHCDYNVGWQEELAGEQVSFDEQWFVVSEEELEELQVVAYRYVTDGCVKGDWEVVFTVGE